MSLLEPFDLTNTARSVYDYETFERVKSVFVASWRILQETLDLNSVFSPIMIPSPASSCISTTSNGVATNNVCCIMTNTNATITTTPATTINENETSDLTIVNDTRNNLEPYLITPPIQKDFNLNENTNNDAAANDNEDMGKNYQDNLNNKDNEQEEFMEQQQEEDDIIIDVNDEYDEDVNNENDMVEGKCTKVVATAVTTTPMVNSCSSNCQKLHKRKDLNRTLTPRQMKIYEDISSSPKSNTKIINRSASNNSSNNKTATNMIS